MSTYFNEESGEYRNFENEVINLLKTIAGEEDEPAEEGGSTTEPEVVEEPVEDPDLTDPEISTGEDGRPE